MLDESMHEGQRCTSMTDCRAIAAVVFYTSILTSPICMNMIRIHFFVKRTRAIVNTIIHANCYICYLTLRCIDKWYVGWHSGHHERLRFDRLLVCTLDRVDLEFAFDLPKRHLFQKLYLQSHTLQDIGTSLWLLSFFVTFANELNIVTGKEIR